jgi:hypothetical protein
LGARNAMIRPAMFWSRGFASNMIALRHGAL